MTASPTYAPILDSELQSSKPATSSCVFRFRDNPLAIMQGAPTSRGAGLGVWVDKSPTGLPYPGSDMQTGIITDCLDVGVFLQPDGLGGVHWSSSQVRCVLMSPATPYPDPIVISPSCSVSTKTTTHYLYPTFRGKQITIGVAASTLKFSFTGLVQPGSGDTFGLSLYRNRQYPASFSTTFSNANANVFFTSVVNGSFGNSLTMTYLNPGAASQALSVVVSGMNITINLATNSSAVITTTANDIVALINSTPATSALITAALFADSTGLGVVDALASQTFMASHYDETSFTTWVYGNLRSDTSACALYTMFVVDHLAGDSYYLGCLNLGGTFNGVLELSQI